jgi:hypothetical protein
MPGLWYLTKLTLCQAIPERPRGRRRRHPPQVRTPSSRDARLFRRNSSDLIARFLQAKLWLPEPVLRERADQLSAIETATIRTNLELKAARLEAVEGRESAGRLLERALASVERLNEVATAITGRLDELLND